MSQRPRDICRKY